MQLPGQSGPVRWAGQTVQAATCFEESIEVLQICQAAQCAQIPEQALS